MELAGKAMVGRFLTEMPEVGAVVYVGCSATSNAVIDVGVVTKTTRCTVTLRSISGRCINARKRVECPFVGGKNVVYEVYDFVPFVPDVATDLGVTTVYRKTKDGNFRATDGMVPVHVHVAAARRHHHCLCMRNESIKNQKVWSGWDESAPGYPRCRRLVRSCASASVIQAL